MILIQQPNRKSGLFFLIDAVGSKYGFYHQASHFHIKSAKSEGEAGKEEIEICPLSKPKAKARKDILPGFFNLLSIQVCWRYMFLIFRGVEFYFIKEALF